MNQAIHTVDLLLWLFGPVARVYANTATRVHDIEVEDTAVATIEFASGALGSMEAATSVYPGFSRRVEVTGSEGTIVIEHDRVISSDLRSGEPGVVSSAAGDANASASSAKVSDTRAHQRIIREIVRVDDPDRPVFGDRRLRLDQRRVDVPAAAGAEDRASAGEVVQVVDAEPHGGMLPQPRSAGEVSSAG